MKLFKRLFAYTCMLAMLLTSVPVPVSAATANPFDEDSEISPADVYQNIMQSSASGYFIACQPYSALNLGSGEGVSLTSDMLSPNYDKGVVDLPRLSSDYYYKVTDNTDKWYLSGSTYPSLCWTPSAVGTYCTLSIKSADTDATLWGTSIINNSLDGVPVSSFKDCSDTMLADLVSAPVAYIEGSIELYDAALHKDGIVMPGYAYYPDGNNYDIRINGTVSTPLTVDISDIAKHYKREASDNNRGVTRSETIRDYASAYSSSSRPALLFAGSKNDSDNYCDVNNSYASTITKSEDINTLYSFIAVDDKCYFQAIDVDSIDTSGLGLVDSSAPSITWNSGIRNTVTDLDGSIVSYNTWWKAMGSSLKLTKIGEYGFQPDTEVTKENINVYARTLIYSGLVEHEATLKVIKNAHKVDIKYYYKEPDSQTWTLYTEKDYDRETVTMGDLETLPDVPNYTANTWYTDTNLSSKFSLSNLSLTTDTAINVYGDYKYSGGEYTVTFYNDATGGTNVAKFECRYLPTLPANPEAAPGYAFKNWVIVDTVDSTTGIAYDANAFVSTAGANYIFKTNWDVTGIVTKVMTTKTNYYIGEDIDKSLLQVHVQTDSAGTTRILGDEEYTITPTTVNKEGVNQFNVKYTATGATAVCEVNGIAVRAMSITATYNGSDLEVGDKLSKDNFNVTLNYNNNTKTKITGFALSPNTIKNVGNNTIVVSYADLSTNVVIVGVEVEEPAAEVTLSKIKGSFTGNKPTDGDNVDPSDFLIKGTYSDGTIKTISSYEFNYTPKVYVESTNSIKFTYGGKSCSVSVVANKKANSTTSSSNSGNKTTTSSSSSSSSSSTTSGSTSSGSTTTSTSGSKTNTSNTSNTSSDTTSKSDDSTDKGASPYYISGATILTATMGNSNVATKNTVDILAAIKDTSDAAQSVTITLTDGATGNEITPEMFKALKAKKLTLNLNMVSPDDNTVSLAKWSFNSTLMESTQVQVNPNVTFEVTDKDSDRAVVMSVVTTAYPKGTTLETYPPTSLYGSNEVVRLYEVTGKARVSNAKATMNWSDSLNKVTFDLTSCYNYGLSNSMSAYESGEDLTVDKTGNDDVTVGGSISDNDIESTDSTTSEEDTFDFGDTEPTDVLTKDTSSKSPLAIIVLIIVLLVIVVGSVVLLLFMKSKGHSQLTIDADDYDDDDEEFTDDSEDVDDTDESDTDE